MGKYAGKVLILLLIFLQITGVCFQMQTAFADTPPSVLQNNWQPIYPANGQFDPVSDQQTGAHTKEWSQDIVGNAQFPSTFYQFSADKSKLSIRVRVNGSDGTDASPEFKNFVFAGVDSNGDGAIDFFLGVYNPAGNNGRVAIYGSDPSAANMGPNSTGISGKPLMAFKPVDAKSHANGNYSITPADSYFNASDNSGTGGSQDYFISFSFKLSEINAALQGLGKSFTVDTPFSFITGTASQDNAFNQDIGGMDSSGWKSGKTWLALGALSPLVSANGVARHTVTFDKNYGDTEPSFLTAVVPDQGTVGTLPSSPTKRGMYFQQWNTAADGTGSMFTSSTPVTSDRTVYAVWGTTPSVQVTFNANGGLFQGGAGTVAVSTINGLVGNNEPSAPTLSGSNFYGWATTDKASSPNYDPSVKINSSITYYAVWSKSGSGYTVVFYNNKDANDHSIYMKAYANNGGQFGSTPFPASPTRSGYTFSGWYDNRNGTGTKATSFPSKSNASYYASWQPVSITLTYNANGGSLIGPDSKAVTDGKFGALPTPPTRGGFNFIEWNRLPDGTGESMNPTSDISSNTTVYAIWGQIGSVVFHANGGAFDDDSTTSSVTTTPSFINAGKSFLDYFPQPPARSGYTFGGWSKTSTGTITVDLKGDMTSNSALYAVWMPNYSVSFDANAGYSQIVATIPTAYGGVLYLPDAPARSKYHFAGWYTHKDGSGASFTTQSVVSGNTTVYAKWQLQPSYTQPGTVGKPLTDTVTDNSITVLPLTPPATGQSIEYAIIQDTPGATLSNWQSSLTFDNLQQDATYYIYARSAEDATHPAGDAQISDPIVVQSNVSYTTTISVPQVNGIDPRTSALQNPSAAQQGATVNLPDASAGMKLGFSFTGWEVTSGGVTITNASQAGNASFTMGSANVAIQANYTANALTFGDQTLYGAANQAFSANVTAATYGSGDYTYTLKSGTLPSGITFNNGAFTGTPTAVANDQVVITATDNVTGASKDASYTLSIVDATTYTTTISVPQVNGIDPRTSALQNPSATQQDATVNLPDASAGMKLGFSFTGWEVTSGGVTITNASQAGNASFTMGSANVAIQANYTANALTFGDQTLYGAANQAFSANVTAATYGSGDYTYTLKSGTLPSGITFNNGAFTGTPTAVANDQVVITATDNVTGASKDASYTLSIVDAPTYTTTISVPQVNGIDPRTSALQNPSATQQGATVNLPDASAGMKLGFSFTGWEVTSGGVTITNTLEAGNASFTMGSANVAIQANYTANALTFDGNTFIGTVGASISNHVTSATGGSGTYTYSLSGTLPGGIQFNNGAFTGTPMAAGSYSVEITATDSNTGAAQTATYTLTIAQQPALVVESQDLTYGETPSPSTNAANSEDVTYMYKKSGENDQMYTSAIPSNAGSYTVLAIATSGDHTRTASKDFNINKKLITITSIAAGKIKGQPDPTLHYEVSGLVGDDVLSGALTRVAGENVGVYPIVSTFANSNYNINYVGSSFTIKSQTNEVPPTPTGGLSGNVQDNTGANLPIIVSVELGKQVIDSVQTDPGGDFNVIGLDDGVYNVVASNGVNSESVLAKVTDGQVTRMNTIILGRIESILEIGSSAPPVAVSGLHDLFSTDVYEGTNYQNEVEYNGGRAQIIFAATGKVESDVPDDAQKIKSISDGQQISFYIDYKVRKSLYDRFDQKIGVDEPLYELPRNIQIVFPLPDGLVGKAINVFRVHNGIPQQLSSDPTQPEYFSVDGKYIALHVSKFSTYAIGLAVSTPEPTQEPTPVPVPTPTPVPVDPPAVPVTDIPTEAFKAVTKVLNTDDHFLYTVGYPDGQWKPRNSVTRAETAMMLYRLLRVKSAPGNNTLSDITQGDWYYSAVTTLANLNIVNGYPDRAFRPNNPITRAEFVSMMERFAQIDTAGKPFSDVPSSHWASANILRASAYGWLEGYPDHTFKPDQFISRAEAVTIINKMLKRTADRNFIKNEANHITLFPDVSPADWAFQAIVESTNSHEYTETDTGETWTWTSVRSN
jgi:uncharacterized repeat protein (TIGR02543 family)